MKHLFWLTPVVLSSALILPGCDKEQSAQPGLIIEDKIDVKPAA